MIQQTAFSLTLALLVHSSTGFWASLPQSYFEQSHQQHTTHLRMAPLSHEEIVARAAQQKQQLQDQQEQQQQPMLFDEDLLADMQAALLLLEKRVQEGPLTMLEVDELKGQIDRIRSEMRLNEHKKPERPAKVDTTVTSTAAPSTTQSPTPPAVVATSRDAGPLVIDQDTPADEGLDYSVRGGMGQPADTVNTYIIPGMDEMTGEEYRAALQRSVIERQQRRKDSGVTGNRATWDYLKQLQYPADVMEK